MAELNHVLKTVLASTTIPPPYSLSGAWRLDRTTGSSAVNDQLNHLAKRGHIDTVAIVPPAHPWSSLLQGGTFKISDPSQDNGSSKKCPKCLHSGNNPQDGNMRIHKLLGAESNLWIAQQKIPLSMDRKEVAARYA